MKTYKLILWISNNIEMISSYLDQFQETTHTQDFEDFGNFEDTWWENVRCTRCSKVDHQINKRQHNDCWI